MTRLTQHRVVTTVGAMNGQPKICDTCGAPATLFRREKNARTIQHGCSQHADLDWKEIDAVGGALYAGALAAVNIHEALGTGTQRKK